MDSKPDAIRNTSDESNESMHGLDKSLPVECESPGPTGNDAKMVELLADIERTRIETGDLFRAIQSNLSPEALKQKATEKMKEITMGKTKDTVNQMSSMVNDVGSSIVELVKDNMAPLIVVGVGISWLIASQLKKSSKNFAEDEESWDSSVFEEEFKEELEEMPERAIDAVTEEAERMREKAETITGRAGEKLQDVRHMVGKTADDIRQTIRRNTGRIKTKSQGSLYARPFLFAGSLLAIGTTLGLILPRTRGEDRMFGCMSDNLMDTLFETGRETITKVKHVADEARRAAVEEAEKQDLLKRDVEKAA